MSRVYSVDLVVNKLDLFLIVINFNFNSSGVSALPISKCKQREISCLIMKPLDCGSVLTQCKINRNSHFFSQTNLLRGVMKHNV